MLMILPEWLGSNVVDMYSDGMSFGTDSSENSENYWDDSTDWVQQVNTFVMDILDNAKTMMLGERSGLDNSIFKSEVFENDFEGDQEQYGGSGRAAATQCSPGGDNQGEGLVWWFVFMAGEIPAAAQCVYQEKTFSKQKVMHMRHCT